MRTLCFVAVVCIFFLAYSQRSQSGCIPYFHTPHMMCLSANLECMSGMCCTRLAENTGCKKDAKIRQLRTIRVHGTRVLWASAKVCIVHQSAPHILNRAAITLGIGPHSTFMCFWSALVLHDFCNVMYSDVFDYFHYLTSYVFSCLLCAWHLV